MKKSEYDNIVLRFSLDTTLIWACRKGDFILWCHCKGFSGGPKDWYTIADVWEMKDGDRVTISNRLQDLPPWFKIHHSETCNALVDQIIKKIKEGYKATEIMEGPAIWRIMSSDCVAWIGKSRTGYKEQDGILQIIDFQTCALMTGDANDPSFESFMDFGTLTDEGQNSKNAYRCRKAFEVVKQVGYPNVLSGEWALG